MECEIERKELLSGLQICRPLTRGRIKPILGCVRMEFGNGKIVLQATDAERALQYKVDAPEAEKELVICVPADQIASIVNVGSGEKVALRSAKESLEVKSARSWHRLPLHDPKEFPKMTPISRLLVTLPAVVVANGLARTYYACDIQSTRYSLGGVMFQPSGDMLNLVATCGRRMAVCKIKAKPDADWEAIVRHKDCQMLRAVLGKEPGEVTIGLTAAGSSMAFETERITYYARLVEGRFPKWQVVIRKEGNTEGTVPAGVLREAMKEARLYCDEEHRAVTFTFSDDRGLVVGAKHPVRGECEIEVPLRYDGEGEMVISLDPRFVDDFLGPLEDSAQITTLTRDPDASLELVASDGVYLAVIMPCAQS